MHIKVIIIMSVMFHHTFKRNGKSFQKNLLGIISTPVLFILNFEIIAPTMKYIMNANIDLQCLFVCVCVCVCVCACSHNYTLLSSIIIDCSWNCIISSVYNTIALLYTYTIINTSPIYPIGAS